MRERERERERWEETRSMGRHGDGGQHRPITCVWICQGVIIHGGPKGWMM